MGLKRIIKPLFLFLLCAFCYTAASTQNNIDTAALRRIAESMKSQSGQLRKDVNGKKNIDSLKQLLGKQQQLLQGFSQGLSSFQLNADSVAIHRMDSISPQTSKQNRVVVNQVMKRKFDTAYTTVSFWVTTEVNMPGGKEISSASGSSQTAVDIYSATSHTITAFYGDANTKLAYNKLVLQKLISRQYVEKLFGLQAQGFYSRNFHDKGQSYTESGSEVMSGVFSLSYDELLQAGSVAGGVNVGTHFLSTTSDGHSSSGNLNKSIDGGGATNPKDYNIPGMASSDKIADTKMPVVKMEKTKSGFKVTSVFSKKEGETVTRKTFTATIGEPLIQYEAVITPVETPGALFEKWVPSGPGPDEKKNEKTGDSVTFKIVVRNKQDTTKTYPGTYIVKWALQDVTHYAGYCNNYPAFTNSPVIDPDFIFSNTLKTNSAFDAANTNGSIATSAMGKGDKAFARVISMDYAAWGKLVANITLDNGQLLIARPWYSKDYGYATIPYDLNENKIADYWEDTVHILNYNYPLTWDEDNKPLNQRGNGDGYTLFEEYRGFAVTDYTGNANIKHLRTNPFNKDAFVCDEDGLFHKYYEALNPSNLSWHYLSADKNQFYFDRKALDRPKNRWVNFNKTDDYFYAPQYALVISFSPNVYNYDPLMTAVSFGVNEWQFAQSFAKTKAIDPTLKDAYDKEAEDPSMFNSPMKTHIKVEIIRQQIENKCAFIKDAGGAAAYSAAVDAQIGNAVIHEIGHCLGIHHHQPQSVDGSKFCAMRYETLEERKNAAVLATRRIKYCTKEDAGPVYDVERDKNGETLKETAMPGKTASDNCYGQISVKCKPGE